MMRQLGARSVEFSGVQDELLHKWMSFFGTDYIIPVGSGTSGLFLVLKALGVKNKRVIVPALCCSNVAVAVFAAGAEPYIVDISSKDCNLSPSALKAAMDSNVGAIIAINSFGYPAPIRAIKEIATRYGCPVIEDACQSYGGVLSGEVLGARADVGIISFGHAKAVDYGGGGLVVTTDRQLHARIVSQQSRPASHLAWRSRNRLARWLMRLNEDRVFRVLSEKGLLGYHFPLRGSEHRARWSAFVADLETMKQALHQLPELIGSIRGTVLFEHHDLGWLPWRFSFRVPDATRRHEIEKVFKENAVRFTHLYDPLHVRFPGVSVASRLLNAERTREQIINLVYPFTLAGVDALLAGLERAKSADRQEATAPSRDWREWQREYWEGLTGLDTCFVLDPNDESGRKNSYIHRVHQAAIRKTLGRISKGKFARVLDFGCGVGRNYDLLTTKCRHYVGVDISEKMLAQAKGDTHLIDGERLPFAAGSFDLIVSFWVLQHVIDDEALDRIFSEFQRCLVVGGKVVLVERSSAEIPWQPHKPKQYINRRSPEIYLEFCAKHNLNLLLSQPLFISRYQRRRHYKDLCKNLVFHFKLPPQASPHPSGENMYVLEKQRQ